MSLAVRGDAVWAALTYHVSDRARLGRLRAAGLQEIAAATGCVTHVHRRSAGITLDVHGARPLVQHLADTLDQLAALMDSCALAATRRYGQWLRDQPDPDHNRTRTT